MPTLDRPLLATLAQNVDVSQLSDAVDTGGLHLTDWLTAAAIAVAAVVVAIVAHRLVAAGLRRRGSEGFAGDLVGRVAAYVLVAVGLVYSLSVLGVRVGPLLGALGIVGIALAFALKDILENFVAGIMLQVRRPFDKGDQIVTGEHEGTVREVNARSVVIDQPSGERVIVPSSALINQPIVNLTAHPARRTTLMVGVAYDADLDVVVGLLGDVVGGVPGVEADPPPQALVEDFGESSIDLAVRYWHRPSIATMWDTRDRVARAIKAALDDAGIDIPFPQRVLWPAPGMGSGSDPDMEG